MFIVQQKKRRNQSNGQGQQTRKRKKKKKKKEKEEEDLIGDVNVVATCCTGFVQIMHFFYFSFHFLYRSNFSFLAETSGMAGIVRYRPVS